MDVSRVNGLFSGGLLKGSCQSSCRQVVMSIMVLSQMVFSGGRFHGPDVKRSCQWACCQMVMLSMVLSISRFNDIFLKQLCQVFLKRSSKWPCCQVIVLMVLSRGNVNGLFSHGLLKGSCQ